MENRIAMYNGNALKIGLFGANCSSGRSATRVPERWMASWPDCLKLAKLADEAGLDFMLPLARWEGYGGDTEFHGPLLQTIPLGVRASVEHQAPGGVRPGARGAVSSFGRGQGIRHRRSYRRRPRPREYRR